MPRRLRRADSRLALSDQALDVGQVENPHAPSRPDGFQDTRPLKGSHGFGRPPQDSGRFAGEYRNKRDCCGGNGRIVRGS